MHIHFKAFCFIHFRKALYKITWGHYCKLMETSAAVWTVCCSPSLLTFYIKKWSLNWVPCIRFFFFFRKMDSFAPLFDMRRSKHFVTFGNIFDKFVFSLSAKKFGCYRFLVFFFFFLLLLFHTCVFFYFLTPVQSSYFWIVDM